MCVQNTIVADTHHVNTQSVCMCIRRLAKPLYIPKTLLTFEIKFSQVRYYSVYCIHKGNNQRLKKPKVTFILKISKFHGNCVSQWGVEGLKFKLIIFGVGVKQIILECCCTDDNKNKTGRSTT